MEMPDPLKIAHPRIKRIVDELVLACRENLAHEIGVWVSVSAYSAEDEVLPNYAEDTLTGHLIGLIETEGIAEVRVAYESSKPDNMPDNEFAFVVLIKFKVTNYGKLLDLLSELEKAKEAHSLPARFEVSTGYLYVGDGVIPFGLESHNYDLLRFLMHDHESRTTDWSHSELRGELSPAHTLKHPEALVRNTANNINRRITAKLGIKNFLVVTSQSVHLNARFV